MMKNRVRQLLSRVKCSCLDKDFTFIIGSDHKDPRPEARTYIQVQYSAICTSTNVPEYWKGRKWYLSEHMTDDEIIKTSFAAFKAAVEHEVLEGFKIDGVTLFNPHVDFEELIKVSHKEVKRSNLISA